MNDDLAARKLIETGVLVDFKITHTEVQPSLDGESLAVQAELRLAADDDEDEFAAESTVEWGAFGFIFVLATLAFADATPRGHSDIDYVKNDTFSVADLLECLNFARGELRFTADYVRGRCVKTTITIRRDGTATLSTRGRGENALRWLGKLQGEKHLGLL